MRAYIILFLTFILIGCKEQPKKTEVYDNIEDSPLFMDVMKIHDEVMPEMATLHRLKAELESLTSNENTEIIGTQIKALNDADEAMMSWMAMFKIPDDKAQQVSYLESEKAKIVEVSALMHKAILEATATLHELKKG